MPQYFSAGVIPHKKHTQLRTKSGDLVYEEMHTTYGFTDIYSLMYHLSPPTTVISVEKATPIRFDEWDSGTHRHHLLDSGNVLSGGSLFDSRRPLLYNDDVVLSVASPTKSSDMFFRNAHSDELICVGAGEGTLSTAFGTLKYGPRDLIVIPRGTTQQWDIDEDIPQTLFIVESKTPITPPARYLNRLGQFTMKSPIGERDIRVPEFQEPHAEIGDHTIRIKIDNEFVDYHYAPHPFDLVGWDGYVYPYIINMSDFEPLSRRIHTMPDDQQIFETGGAAICCLVPRPLDWHPDAIPAAPYHASIDVDEVMFNMSNVFMGWSRVGLGVMTLHPRGILHGPKPGGYEKSIGMKEFDGTAIMVDVANPLKLTAFAELCDDESYPSAWLSDEEKANLKEKGL